MSELRTSIGFDFLHLCEKVRKLFLRVEIELLVLYFVSEVAVPAGASRVEVNTP